MEAVVTMDKSLLYIKFTRGFLPGKRINFINEKNYICIFVYENILLFALLL